MNRNAFTLIEVMVVMAIISILAGMMTPVVWNWWESQDIAMTRQRLKELKLAMIGDRGLVQNGARTHFGFVGDFGELPFDNHSSCAFSFLNSKDALTGSTRYDPDNWSSRYLPSSADPNNYAVDAWGNPIKCVNKINLDGRWVALTLHCTTPSGEVLEENILESDVTPTNRIAGNIFGNFSSIKLSFNPEKAGAFFPFSTPCKLVKPFSSYTTLLQHKLPIGRVSIDVEYSSSSACSSPNTMKLHYMVNDNLTDIKLPDIK